MADTRKFLDLAQLTNYTTQMKALIANADLAAVASAGSYTDQEVKKIQDAIDVINNTDTGLLAQSKAYTDQEVKEVQDALDLLEALVGTLPSDTEAKTIVEYVDLKTANIASDETVGAIADRVKAIEDDYLVEDDKTELSNAITAEKERAEEIESGLRTDVDAIKSDYLKTADKQELQGNIDTVSSGLAAVKEDIDTFLADADVTEKAVDTLKEIQEYITSDGEAAATMTANIAENAKAIEDEISRATGKEAELQAAIDAKVAQTVYDAKVAELAGADTAMAERITSLENANKEGGSVATAIEDAKSEAIDTAASDATTKANQALTDSKAYTDTEVGKDRTRLDALEADTHTHSNKELLDTYDQTNADIKDAVTKKHEHANLSILEAITQAKVNAWDAALQASDIATGSGDGTISVKGTDVAVKGLGSAAFTNSDAYDVAGAAAAVDTKLTTEAETRESADAALQAQIDEFVEISQEDIENLFNIGW